MAATAWNLRKWLIAFFCLAFYWLRQQVGTEKTDVKWNA